MKWCLMERYVVQFLFLSWSTVFASLLIRMLPTGQIKWHETESRDPCNKASCDRGSSLPHGMQGQGR